MLKCIFFLLVSFCCCNQLGAQKWDSTYRPASFATRVEQFRSYADSGKEIIFLGNSITAGVDWSELLQRNDVKNRGISSDISFGVLERLDEVTARKPSKIFILIGINDISRNIPDSFIVANYQRMICRIKNESPATKIYLQTLLPVNNQFTQFKNHYNKDGHIEYVNSEIRKMGEDGKVIIIDLHPQFLDGEGRLDKKYTMDGLHLNANGYNRWKEILLKGKYL